MKTSFRRSRVVATVLVSALTLAGPAALAQADRDERLPENLEELPERVEEAVRGLIDSMRPALEDAMDLFQVLEQIDSPANYGKPVILPNGDILIPRSPDAPEWDPGPEEGDAPPRQRRPALDPNEGTPI